MNRQTVGRRINHLPRRDQRIHGKIGGDRIGREIVFRRAGPDGRARGAPAVGMQVRYTIGGCGRTPLQTFAGGDLPRGAVIHRDPPDVAAIDVVLVRRENGFLAVAGEGYVLSLIHI